ncbi:CBS domain-containing protein [Hyphococcus sp.]|uniref:CBS domain-containing protein n=1 Tax=Hyphococcus sp. TaxID=2038636 RepID=UPI003D0EE301
MKVSDLLNRKGRAAPHIRKQSKVSEVISQLKTDEASALVVVDDDNEILGIISEHNVVRALEEYGKEALDHAVADIMTAPVVTCEEQATLDQVMALMDHHKIRHVPVVCDSTLCGVVSIYDILSQKMSELSQEAEALKAYVAGSL